jgi:hypothetical protein
VWSASSSDTVSSAITAANAARGRPDSSEGSLVNLYPVSVLDTLVFSLIDVALFACTAAFQMQLSLSNNSASEFGQLEMRYEVVSQNFSIKCMPRVT